MAWKDWSYWLRGGIIGLIYFLVTMTIGYSMPSSDPAYKGIFGALLNTPAILIAQFVIRPIISLLFDYNNVVSFIAVMISNFLIGALIGWIYGKIKNRKLDDGNKK